MRDGQRTLGFALLSALFSVALLTVVVLEMTDATLVGSHLTRNAANAIAAGLLARSAEVAAESLLVDQDRRYPGVTAPDQEWGQPWPDVPAGDGFAGFAIHDEQGKLDLNRVRDGEQRRWLEALFADLELDPALLDAIDAWTRPPDGGGAAAACALAIPCRPREGPLTSLEGHVLIEGFSPEDVARLRPFVTAFGQAGRKGVNVNTARPRVLRAMGCDLGDDFRAPPGGYRTTADVVECQGVRGLSIDSDVFSIEARGTVGDTSRLVVAVVDRRGGKVRRLAWREGPVFPASPIAVP